MRQPVHSLIVIDGSQHQHQLSLLKLQHSESTGLAGLGCSTEENI